MSSDGFYTIVFILGTVFSFVLVIGGALWVAKQRAGVGAAESWRQVAEAEKARGEGNRAEIEQLKKRLAVVERDNATLREMVTGHKEIVALTKIVQEQHAEVLKRLAVRTT